MEEEDEEEMGGGDEKKKKEKTFVTKGAKYLRLDKNYFPLTLNNN